MIAKEMIQLSEALQEWLTIPDRLPPFLEKIHRKDSDAWTSATIGHYRIRETEGRFVVMKWRQRKPSPGAPSFATDFEALAFINWLAAKNMGRQHLLRSG